MRIVLSHELAHIERHDVAWQLVARVSAAVHWYNPLVWFASGKMRMEREIACDDRALAAGIEPTDYAQGLVEVAAALSRRRRIALGAPSMADPSDLERRVNSVLNTSLPRYAASRRFRRNLLVFMAGWVLIFGSLRPFAPHRAATAQVDDRLESSRPAVQTDAAQGGAEKTPIANQEAAAPSAKEGATKGILRLVGAVVGPNGRPIAGAQVRYLDALNTYSTEEAWLRDVAVIRRPLQRHVPRPDDHRCRRSICSRRQLERKATGE